MQETLAYEWRRRMAARSSLVAMLLAVPVMAAVVIGFSGGVGSLPFGISSLAGGPSADSVGAQGGVAPALNLTAVSGAPAAVAVGTSAAAAGAPEGGGLTAQSPGTAAPGVDALPPAGSAPPAGETRTPGETGGAGGGGGVAGGAPPPAPAPEPGNVIADPAGAVNGAVGQVRDTVGNLLSPPR